MNFIIFNSVGKDFEEITGEDVQAMLQGTWDQGLASAAGEIGSLAYAFPPAHFKDYVQRELADNLLSNPAEAQETEGTKALEPIQDVWKGMRNVAYGLFAVVVVAIGFMIIFRKEISPRVVITFTSALPKILIGLILITFSFPIIALIIDIGVIFGTQMILKITEGVFEPILVQASGGAAGAFSAVPPLLIGTFLASLTGLGGVAAFVLLLLTVIYALTALILVGLTIVRLVINYGWLLVYTIFSPILLLFGALPGQEGSIATFFKNVLAKTLAFPAIFFFVLLGAHFAGAFLAGTRQNFLSGNLGGLVTGALSTQGILGAILGLVMLAAAFKAPSLVEEALGGGKPKKK